MVKYLMHISNKKSFLPLQEAVDTYESNRILVRVGGLVLEGDNSTVRDITPEEKEKIAGPSA